MLLTTDLQMSSRGRSQTKYFMYIAIMNNA